MLEFKLYTAQEKPTPMEKEDLIDFLYHHLEQYGDARSAIEKAIDYSLENYTSFGGFVLTATRNKELAGVVVINRTGMNDYIPENILVYIAVHPKFRGQGLGRKVMQEAINQAEGNIALHVEPDNPARLLYEKLGFSSKYLEMRLEKK